MIEKDTAKLEKPDIPRWSSCSYPSSARNSASVFEADDESEAGDEGEGRDAIATPENGGPVPAVAES
jgi:hypothetical protein